MIAGPVYDDETHVNERKEENISTDYNLATNRMAENDENKNLSGNHVLNVTESATSNHWNVSTVENRER